MENKPKVFATLVFIAVGACLALWINSNNMKTGSVGDFFNEMAPAVEAFKKDIGRYPNTHEGLLALYESPAGLESKWNKYMLGYYSEMKDRWGRHYVYICPGIQNPGKYDIFSLGADGLVSEDDIGNWSNKQLRLVSETEAVMSKNNARRPEGGSPTVNPSPETPAPR